MVLLIDNYDSFSYNLYQLVGSINPNIRVIRNDETTAEKISELNPERIILSPGPGKPNDAGICIDVIRKLGRNIPILGVCLGHQAIFEAFGGTVSYAQKVMHGKMSKVEVNNKNALFKGLPPVIQAARYHSLAGIAETLPDELEITASVKEGSGEIMAVSHKKYKIYGVQFHPESILTPQGYTIIDNFLR